MRAIGSGSLAVRREIPRAILSSARSGPTPSRDRVRMADVEIPDAGPVTRHPCGIDPENPAHWPWNVAPTWPTRLRSLAVPEVPDDVRAEYAARPFVPSDPRVIRPCTAFGCTAHSAAVRRRTHPELRDFCEQHRRAGLTRILRGRHPAVVADDMTAGSRTVGRPRSGA